VFETSWASISQGTGCPYCVNQKVNYNNCLAIKNPKLAAEWHPIKNGNLTPYDVMPNSHNKVWWRCSKNSNHEWETTVHNRNYGRNCPYCSGYFASEDYNLLICNPELANEWNYNKNRKNPENYAPNSGNIVWWKCIKNHEWQESICNRNKGYACPYCSGKRASKEYNLLVINSKLCEEWDYKKNKKKPEEYTPNSGKKVWWVCKECGYQWKALISNRNKGRGCPECNKSKGENKIKEWLDNNNIEHQGQKDFQGLIGLGNGNLSYDFYLPEYNLLVEYQGEFHESQQKHVSKEKFLKQKEHDKRKREYAQNNNINLLEIWYWDFDNIESILQKELGLQEVVAI